MMGLSMCSITMLPNIPMTTCSLCSGESASSLSLMPLTTFCLTSFSKEIPDSTSFISSPF